MVIFHGYVSLPEGKGWDLEWFSPLKKTRVHVDKVVIDFCKDHFYFGSCESNDGSSHARMVDNRVHRWVIIS